MDRLKQQNFAVRIPLTIWNVNSELVLKEALTLYYGSLHQNT
jgi:hypothetical protein